MLTTTPRDSPPKEAAGSIATDSAAVAVRGDFAGLVDAFQSPLLRYARRLLGPGDDAEDVVQEAFIRYHRQVAGKGRPTPDSPRSWLYRVVHNRAMDMRRKRKRRTDHQPRLTERARAAAADHAADAPVDELLHAESIAHALAALDDLPEEQRQIVVLKVMHGLTLREVAEVMDMPFGNVNYRLNRALADLAGKLKRKGVV